MKQVSILDTSYYHLDSCKRYNEHVTFTLDQLVTIPILSKIYQVITNDDKF